MNPKRDFWEAIRDHLDGGWRVFVAMVVDHTRHSPGTSGARMYVSEDGTVEGTIGGGIMEHDVIEAARERLRKASSEPEVVTLVHRDRGPGEKSGMHCAGSQTNVYYVLDPILHIGLVWKIIDTLDSKSRAILRINKQKMDVVASMRFEGASHLSSLGDKWEYTERLSNPLQLAIMGSGHCGLSLSRLMCRLGYDITVYDTRRDLFTFTRNEFARKVVVASFREAGPMIEDASRTPVIVMTPDLKSDVESLLSIVSLDIPFIGVMGSPAKISRIRKMLFEEGILESNLDRLRAPVGLAIGSRTPEEIAVSVAAQILEWRNGLSA